MQAVMDWIKQADATVFVVTLFILKLMGYSALIIIAGILKYALIKKIIQVELHQHQPPAGLNTGTRPQEPQ